MRLESFGQDPSVFIGDFDLLWVTCDTIPELLNEFDALLLWCSIELRRHGHFIRHWNRAATAV
jgi:hypothetical protein